ncbi:hypothetical protein [Pedosphaera parvula]|uniref:Lipoprotein n=1 Tax=Pedosphaera parvula (strain Ellin514) TaxID=320771 RepID=B9XQW0_PEDPL|nr:hypothetical protein [Pedosphaera parvula]EEF57737.1 hypothetical protein Cflav_PD0619 [Pedosphaera parvula Ellin514]
MKKCCWACFAAVSLLISGCATTERQAPLALTGNIAVDGPNAIANGPKRDKVLWEYRTAAADLRKGQFQEAKTMLDDALLTRGGIYGKDRCEAGAWLLPRRGEEDVHRRTV